MAPNQLLMSKCGTSVPAELREEFEKFLEFKEKKKRQIELYGEVFTRETTEGVELIDPARISLRMD